MREECIEAASRSECVAKCKSQGIAPISIIEQAESFNKSTRVATYKTNTGKNLRLSTRFICACISLPIVAILVISITLLLLRDENKTAQSESQEIHIRKPLIKPTVQEKNAEKPIKNYNSLSNIELRRLPESETNNLTNAQIEYWKMFHPYPPPSKDQPKALRAKYQIFECRTDNEIAFILSVEPGTMVIGNGGGRRNFTDRFLKSLNRPIVIKDGDSEYNRNLKKAVLAARSNLKAALDRGENIEQIMDDARDDVLKLARYRAQIEKEAIKILLKPSISKDDAGDVIKAVNQMLESKGIAPLNLNTMSRLAIKYQNIIYKE